MKRTETASQEKTMRTKINAEFENQVLSVGREFLPAVALKVLDQQPLTRAEQKEYRVWIIGQARQMDAEAEMAGACGHRDGDGAASAAELASTQPGETCAICGATLGIDGYWYIDADQAPL